MTKKVKLSLCDDHTIFRTGLKRILERYTGFKVVGDYSDGEEMLNALKSDNPNILITDISLEGISGLDVLKQAKEMLPDLTVLVLSMHSEDVYGIRAIKIGADAYLKKDCPEHQLIDALNAIAKGEKYFTPRMNDMLLNEISKKQGEPHEILSDREFEVLILLGKGATTNEIAHTLYLSPKTISTYKKRINDKLSISNMADLINYVNKHQLV